MTSTRNEYIQPRRLLSSGTLLATVLFIAIVTIVIITFFSQAGDSSSMSGMPGMPGMSVEPTTEDGGMPGMDMDGNDSMDEQPTPVR